METSSENAQQHVFLDRSSRATRGKRITKLLDDEIEEVELFWNQDALKEEEQDIEYEEEGEVADVFDSDFDEDEPNADEEAEMEPDDRPTKKKLICPGKAPPKKKQKKNKVHSKLESTPKDEKTPEEATPSELHDIPDDAEAEKVVRKSTRTSVIIRQAERDAIRAALQATMKPIKKKKEGEEKRMIQEEMLLEAAQTEIMNLRNLERVSAREEEVKKRAIVNKAVYNGPQTQYLSKNDPEKGICAVTGLPAIYRHPKTGLPYATKEAFKIIRERFTEESSTSQKESSLGLLMHANYEQGFSQKKKRLHAKIEVRLFKLQMYSTLQIAVIFLLSIGYSVCASSHNGYVDNYITKSFFNRYDSLIDQKFNHFVANEIPLALFKDKHYVLPTLSSLRRYVTGEGSHRHLSSSIRFKLNHELKNELISHSCEVIIIERLPSGVFADPFELQHLVQRNVFTNLAVFGDKNLELPSFRSNRTVVEIHMSLASEMLSSHEDDLLFNLQVPLHARYPALGLGFSRVKFGKPDLFLCCNIKENVANMSCQSILILDTETNSDTWEIPCGIKEHARIVSVVTFTVAVIAALLIVYTSITYSTL